jgi:5'-nucleotidase
MVRILLSNDDGIASEGLRALYDAVSGLGETTVVAPDREQSVASHSLTLHRPLRIQSAGNDWFAVDGTPADCINLALNGIFKDRRPDIVLSGINKGCNMGDDITYSGTVAAAMEATLLGVPSAAISLVHENGEPLNFELAASFAPKILREILDRGLGEGVLLNVNVPNIPVKDCRGVRVTRQGRRVYGNGIVERVDPRGREYYWIGGSGLNWVREPGTDFEAVTENAISVTPLRLDMTDFDFMGDIEKWTFE